MMKFVVIWDARGEGSEGWLERGSGGWEGEAILDGSAKEIEH